MHLLLQVAMLRPLPLPSIIAHSVSLIALTTTLRSSLLALTRTAALHSQAWRKEQRPPARGPGRSARRQRKPCRQLRRRPQLRSRRPSKRRRSSSGRSAGVWHPQNARCCSPSSIRRMARCDEAEEWVLCEMSAWRAQLYTYNHAKVDCTGDQQNVRSKLRRFLARCLCLVTATAASWGWART